MTLGVDFGGGANPYATASHQLRPRGHLWTSIGRRVTMGSVEANRYGRVLAAWLVGAFGPASAMLVYYRNGPDCEGGGFYGCRWGIDGLDGIGIVSAFIISLVTVGPLAIYVVLRAAGDRLSARTAGLTVAFAVPVGLTASFLGIGALAPLAAVSIGGRLVALRIGR